MLSTNDKLMIEILKFIKEFQSEVKPQYKFELDLNKQLEAKK